MSEDVTANALDAAERVMYELPCAVREDAADIVRSYLDALDPYEVARTSPYFEDDEGIVFADAIAAVRP